MLVLGEMPFSTAFRAPFVWFRGFRGPNSRRAKSETSGKLLAPRSVRKKGQTSQIVPGRAGKAGFAGRLIPRASQPVLRRQPLRQSRDRRGYSRRGLPGRGTRLLPANGERRLAQR